MHTSFMCDSNNAYAHENHRDEEVGTHRNILKTISVRRNGISVA